MAETQRDTIGGKKSEVVTKLACENRLRKQVANTARGAAPAAPRAMFATYLRNLFSQANFATTSDFFAANGMHEFLKAFQEGDEDWSGELDPVGGKGVRSGCKISSRK